MVCEDIYGECRCYAYTDTPTIQFCGKRRGPHVIPCSVECCVGGCSEPHPYRIIDRPPPLGRFEGTKAPLLVIWVLVALFVLFLFSTT